MDNPNDSQPNNAAEQEHQPQGKRPSCLLEFILFLVLSSMMIAGLTRLMGPYLRSAFDSIFGMGLK